MEIFVTEFIREQMSKLPKVFVYTSNARLQEQYNPDKHGKNLFGFIASGSENHMILGMIEQHLTWCESEDEIIQKLKEL